ncbi:hypothetical protein MFIFM68171_06568 [Madurella fahalii]|uniref:Uncharacterized protein n=1 Tax=Madurella fahalii TaxID=1157608 RepID=A0ABQ0GF47_9PEZI
MSYPLRIETSPPPPPRRYSTFTATAHRDIGTPKYHGGYRDEENYLRGRRRRRQPSIAYAQASPRFSPTSPRQRTPSPWTSMSEGESERYQATKPVRRRRKRHANGPPELDKYYSDDLDIIHSPPPQLQQIVRERPLHPVALYSFAASRLGTSRKSSETDSIEDGKQEPGFGETNRSAIGLPACHVLASRYDGEGYLGGRHTVQLTTLMSSNFLSNSLFRWIHFTQRLMDFDEFSTQALQVPGLTGSEKKGLSEMIASIKRDHVRSIQTSTGCYVGSMEPKFIQNLLPLGSSPAEQALAPRTVTWICLPYFTLERYSGLLSADNPRMFPIQTLLQAQFAGTTRERDMQQAVLHRKGSPEACFHIAQLWCLILDNSLLLTCSRMSEDDLCNGSIYGLADSVQGLSTSGPGPMLSVRYRGDVVWSIPVVECQSWFSFLSHFREFWPNSVQFFRHKERVTADDWPKIYNRALRSDSQIVLDLQVGPPSNPPVARLLGPLERNEHVQGKAKAATPTMQPGIQKLTTNQASTTPQGIKGSDTEKPKHNRSFAVFTCLDGVSASSSSDVKTFSEQFSEVDAYLQSETAFGDHWAYSDCQPASRRSVYELLETEVKTLFGQPQSRKAKERQADYEKRISLFSFANTVFEFFFSPEAEAPTVAKFWGAIKVLVQYSPPPYGHSDDSQEPGVSAWSLDKITNALRDIAVDVMSFNEIFVHAQQSDRAKITTPLTLIDAWIHLVLGLVTLPSDRIRSHELVCGASGLLKKGINTMIEALPGQPVSKSSVVLPLELVSLMSMRVLKDVAPGVIPENPNAPDISATYSSCLSAVEANISNSKIPDRGHERSIGLLKQEMAIIQWTIQTQQSIFKGMLTAAKMLNPTHRESDLMIIDTETSRVVAEGKSYDPMLPTKLVDAEQDQDRSRRFDQEPITRVVRSELAVSGSGGLRPLLIRECLRHLGRRERQFSEMLIHASQLEEENRNNVSRTKDRQERAIYAFTIVTVIFLPLSAVASIFGMNSADIREMELGQWAYWATAVPVTLVVMFLGLLWTGELGNALQWAASFGRGGYVEGARNVRFMERERPRVVDRFTRRRRW